MTITGALAYGELAAMMPHAGGQYVYLRESLGPLWGFLYGWTLFLVIQTGTIAAVGVAFGKFLGVFFPSVSSTNWILHLWNVPPIPIGPMVLGNMDVGLNTQNLVAILIVVFLSVLNIFGVSTGAAVQNVFTFAKTAALLGLVLARAVRRPQRRTPSPRTSARTSGAMPAGARCIRCRSASAAPSRWWHVHLPGGRAGRVAVLRRRLEQRDLHRRRSQESPAQLCRCRWRWAPAW